MSRRPPHQSTPYGSKHLPEPSGMNSAFNNLRQSAPADEQQELLPHEHEWLSPEEIDALGARRNRPTIPTNGYWRSYSGRAGGLTSSTPLPASPYANQDQSRQSEMQRYGSYGDPPYGGFPSTAPPANLSSYQDQNRQGDISGETGLENDDQPWTPFTHNELASKIMAKMTWEAIASEMRRDVKKVQDKWWHIKKGYPGVEYNPAGKPRKQPEKKETKKPRGGR